MSDTLSERLRRMAQLPTDPETENILREAADVLEEMESKDRLKTREIVAATEDYRKAEAESARLREQLAEAQREVSCGTDVPGACRNPLGHRCRECHGWTTQRKHDALNTAECHLDAALALLERCESQL